MISMMADLPVLERPLMTLTALGSKDTMRGADCVCRGQRTIERIWNLIKRPPTALLLFRRWLVGSSNAQVFFAAFTDSSRDSGICWVRPTSFRWHYRRRFDIYSGHSAP